MLVIGAGGNLPSSSKYRYHQAARDGYLDLLKGSTRRDCDRADEDGMTPTMWASYHGNLEALRLIVSRGGNPDKADLLGNTSLHHAVIHGHITCVSFLVTFGANIWAMDNDFRTPLDLAGLYNHMDIVKYLDAMAASETVKDKKAVNKSKQKSYERAVDSVKRFRRMQADTTKKLEKEQEKLLQRSNGDASSTQAVEGAASSGGGGGGVKSRFGTVTSLNLFSDSKSFLGRSIRGFPVGKKHATFSSSSAAGCPKSFSDISGIQATVRRERKADSKGASSSDAKNGLLDANSKKIKWKGSLDLAVSGSSDSGSISATPTTPPRRGLVRDFQVMYVDKSASSKNGISMDPEAMDAVLNRATSEPDLTMSGDSGIMEEEDDELPPSIFDRKGFGELAFFRHRPPQVVQESAFKDALLSLPGADETADEEGISVAEGNDAIPNRSETWVEGIGSCKMSVSSGGDIGLPWDVDALLEDLDDDVNDIGTSTPLESFLAAHGLRNFLGILAAEKIDLESLCLCSDADLKEIGVPLGPRRKILDVVSKRKQTLASPQTVSDANL